MTKRDAAVVGVRIVALFLLVEGLKSLISQLIMVPSLVNYAPTVKDVRVLPGPYIALQMLPALSGFVFSIILWILSSRIGTAIFPHSQAEECIRSMSARGWLVTAAFLLGLQMFIWSLPYLYVGGFMFYTHTIGWGIYPASMHNTLSDMTSFVNLRGRAIGGLVDLITALFLMLAPARVAAWAEPKGIEKGTKSWDIAVLAVRLFAVYISFSYLSVLPGELASTWIHWVIVPGKPLFPTSDWSVSAPGIVTSILAVVITILVWRFTPSIIRFLSHRAATEEPETLEPVQPA